MARMKAETKTKIKIVRNALPHGYFFAEDLDTGEVYYAQIHWSRVKPDLPPTLSIYKYVDQEELIPSGDGQMLMIIKRYVLEEDFEPPVITPTFRSEKTVKDEFQVIQPIQLEPVDWRGLYDDLLEYNKKHIWFRDEATYHVVTAWEMATWLPELFESYTYLALIGPYESGKTRVLETIMHVSYNSLLAASASAAVIPRLIELFNATLMIDESQLLNKDDSAEIIAILNAGYRRKGGVYARAQREGAGVDVRKVAGFKAFGCPEVLTRSLQTRAVEINMMELPKPTLVRFVVDEKTARLLRWRLLRWRAYRLREKHELDLEALANELFSKGIRNRRLCEIGIPLYYVTPEEYRHYIIDYLIMLSEKKKSERQVSLDATVIEAVASLQNFVENGKLPVSIITDKVNEILELDEKGKGYNVRTIGRILSKLNFRKCRLTGGKMAIVYDKQLIVELAIRYGVELPEDFQNLLSVIESESKNVSHEIHAKNGESVNLGEQNVHENLETENKQGNSEVSEISEVSEVSGEMKKQLFQRDIHRSIPKHEQQEDISENYDYGIKILNPEKTSLTSLTSLAETTSKTNKIEEFKSQENAKTRKKAVQTKSEQNGEFSVREIVIDVLNFIGDEGVSLRDLARFLIRDRKVRNPDPILKWMRREGFIYWVKEGDDVKVYKV